MKTTKLTLSVPGAVVLDAKRLSRARGESISAMFARFVASVSRDIRRESSFPPMTSRAMALAMDAPPVPSRLDWRSVRDERLAERYAR